MIRFIRISDLPGVIASTDPEELPQLAHDIAYRLFVMDRRRELLRLYADRFSEGLLDVLVAPDLGEAQEAALRALESRFVRPFGAPPVPPVWPPDGICEVAP